jgi:hypothetical protein
MMNGLAYLIFVATGQFHISEENNEVKLGLWAKMRRWSWRKGKCVGWAMGEYQIGTNGASSSDLKRIEIEDVPGNWIVGRRLRRRQFLNTSRICEELKIFHISFLWDLGKNRRDKHIWEMGDGG